MNSPNPNIVIFRTDRIGDLVLSVGVAEHLKTRLTNPRITFVTREYTAPVLYENPFIDRIITLDGCSYTDAAKLIAGNNISIALFASKDAAYPAFLARIPKRIGPFSKFRSFLFNVRISQHRSNSIKNEGEYNLDLVNTAFGFTGLTYPKMYMNSLEIEWGRSFLEEMGIEQGEPFAIVHPGSGGSSLELPIGKYLQLLKLLDARGIKVIVSGSQRELAVYRCILEEKYLFPRALSLREFFSVISLAKVFVSNSTGPLHAASALGVKTVGFYPLLKTASLVRWGVFAERQEDHLVFTPDAPPCNKCKTSCAYYPCMERISLEEPADKIAGLMKG